MTEAAVAGTQTRRWVKGGTAALLVTLGPLAFAQPARADEAADIAAARTFGGDGVLLADAGQCSKAIEKLERAERLHRAPTTAGRLGECQIEVGKIVAGTELLQRLLREPLAPNAPPAFALAMARAQKVLDAALPRIANLRVSLKAPRGTKIALSIDGELVSDVFVDNDRPTDPGAHEVKVTAQGYLPASASVVIKEGESKPVVLELRRDPGAPLAAAAPITRPPVSSASTSSARSAAMYGAFGLGAAGVVVGTLGGGVVASKSSTLSSECVNRVCPTKDAALISSAKGWATVSTVGFVVGGVGLGAGVVLLLLPSRKASSAAATALAVRPVIGPAFLGLDGNF